MPNFLKKRALNQNKDSQSHYYDSWYSGFPYEKTKIKFMIHFEFSEENPKLGTVILKCSITVLV